MNRILERNHVVVSGSNNQNDVVYLMMKSFRIRYNFGLYQSMMYAKKHGCRLRVVCLEPYELHDRHRQYFSGYVLDLLDKLKTYADQVDYLMRDSQFLVSLHSAHTIFMDQCYLEIDQPVFQAVKNYCLKTDTILITVESNVCVPVMAVSDKEEYAARTIRPKIYRCLPDFCKAVLENEKPSKAEKDGWERFIRFKNEKLAFYGERNDPSKDRLSQLSPFLKYGFISPLMIYLDLKERTDEASKMFLEELIVRRELAYNYVFYRKGYDQFETMTDAWAMRTMKQHEGDSREYVYTKEDYLEFKTHDRYFNAAMIEMVYLGKMHSYMRMYWCKKLIEWSETYKEAYRLAIELNNTYFYDGLTPNSYAGVAWCFGRHDRAWFERPIFGKLRYMNDHGLERKFDIEAYVHQMNQIKEEGKK